MIDCVVPACPCVQRHNPKPVYLQKHHIVPKSWGGADTADNIVAICGTTHDATHDALNKLVKAQGHTDLSAYPRFARELAVQAAQAYVTEHGSWPHVYTLAHPPAGDI